jgi:hypothetical protein
MGTRHHALDDEVLEEDRPDKQAERRRHLEKSLEQGLEDSFPASDPINGPSRLPPRAIKSHNKAGWTPNLAPPAPGGAIYHARRCFCRSLTFFAES